MLDLLFGGLLGGLGSLVSEHLANKHRNETLEKADKLFNDRLKENNISREGHRRDLDKLLQESNAHDIFNDIDKAVNNYTPSRYNKYLEQQATDSVRNKMKDLGLYNSQIGQQQVMNQAALAAGAGLGDYVHEAGNRQHAKDAFNLSILDRKQALDESSNNEAAQAAMANYNNLTGGANSSYAYNTRAPIGDAITSKSVDSIYDRLKEQNDYNFAKEHQTATNETLQKK